MSLDHGSAYNSYNAYHDGYHAAYPPGMPFTQAPYPHPVHAAYQHPPVQPFAGPSQVPMMGAFPPAPHAYPPSAHAAYPPQVGGTASPYRPLTARDTLYTGATSAPYNMASTAAACQCAACGKDMSHEL